MWTLLRGAVRDKTPKFGSQLASSTQYRSSRRVRDRRSSTRLSFNRSCRLRGHLLPRRRRRRHLLEQVAQAERHLTAANLSNAKHFDLFARLRQRDTCCGQSSQHSCLAGGRVDGLRIGQRLRSPIRQVGTLGLRQVGANKLVAGLRARAEQQVACESAPRADSRRIEEVLAGAKVAFHATCCGQLSSQSQRIRR